MAYNATYDSNDVSAVAIDTLVTIGVAFASLATLIGLVILWGFIRKRMK